MSATVLSYPAAGLDAWLAILGLGRDGEGGGAGDPWTRLPEGAAAREPDRAGVEAGETAGGAAARALDAERIREDELIGRARRGDEDAFRSLVERYQDPVLSLALRMLGHREAAEEVAQDAFVRAWRALPSFRGDARFSTWLYRITVRRATSEIEAMRARRRRETSDGIDVDSIPASSAVAPADRERLRLERLVAALPVVQRTAITLFYLEGRSIADVAAVLEMPENTIKTHLHRARASLRRGWLREAGRGAGGGLGLRRF